MNRADQIKNIISILDGLEFQGGHAESIAGDKLICIVKDLAKIMKDINSELNSLSDDFNDL